MSSVRPCRSLCSSSAEPTLYSIVSGSSHILFCLCQGRGTPGWDECSIGEHVSHSPFIPLPPFFSSLITFGGRLSLSWAWTVLVVG